MLRPAWLGRQARAEREKRKRGEAPGGDPSATEDVVWCAARASVGPVFERMSGLLQLYAQYASNHAFSKVDI